MAQCIYKETEQRSGHDKGSLLRFSPQLRYSGWDRRTDLSGQEKAIIQAVAQFSAWFSDINKTSPTYSMPFPSACYTVHIILLLSKALQAISCTTTYPPVYSPHPSHHLSCTSSSTHRMAYQMGPGLLIQRGEATQNRSPPRLVQLPNQLVPVLKLVASLMCWRAQQLRERDLSQ